MPNHSRFYSSLGLLILLNMVIKPLWIFGIDRQVQNLAGTAAYGVYFAVFGLTAVLGFLLDWGITNFFNRELAAANANPVSRTGAFIRLKIIFAIIYSAVVIAIAWLSGIRQWTIVFSLIGIQVLSSFFLFFRAIITASQWFTTDAWLSVLDKSLMIIFCGSFLLLPALSGHLSIHTFLFLQLAATVLAILAVIIILVRKNFPLHIFEKTGLTKKDMLAVLPFAMIVLLMSAHNRLDGFLLERLRPDGAYQAGIYASAYRLLDAANMIGYLFASFLLPYIAGKFSRHEKMDEVILSSRHILILFSILVSFCAVFLAPSIQQLLYKKNEAEANTVLQLGIPALTGYALTQIYGTVLTASGHIRTFCFIVLISLLINTGLNLLLIPAYGAAGSCIAALVSQGICGVATIFACVRKPGLKPGWNSIGLYLLTALVLYIYFYAAGSLAIHPWLMAAGAGLLTIIMALITGLASIRNLKQLILPIKN